MALVAMNLYTYARLTHEQDAARVSMRQLGERHYVRDACRRRRRPPRHFELRGDEWQIDARVLKWRAMGNLLGFDTVYRLERLSGRYGDITQERGAARTVHSLAEDPGLDFWTLLQNAPRVRAARGRALRQRRLRADGRGRRVRGHRVDERARGAPRQRRRAQGGRRVEVKVLLLALWSFSCYPDAQQRYFQDAGAPPEPAAAHPRNAGRTATCGPAWCSTARRSASRAARCAPPPARRAAGRSSPRR